MSIRRALLLLLLVGPTLVLPNAGFGAGAGAQDTIAEAQAAIAAATAEVEAAEVELADAQEAANVASEELWAGHDAKEAIEVEIVALEADVAEAEAKLEVLAEDVRSIAISNYVGSLQGSGILDGGDLNESARADALSRYIANTRVDSVDEYSVARSELSFLEEELAAKLEVQEALIVDLEDAETDANDLLADLTTKTVELDTKVAELEAIEARLIAEEEARRAAEEAERQRLAAQEAARLAAEEEARKAAENPTPTPDPAATAAPEATPGPTTEGEETPPAATAEPTPDPTVAPPPVASTGWVCPVAGPNSFIDSWGAPRAYGRWHKGTDMMAETGVPVVAVVSGTVEHRGNSVGGMSAHLKADDGTYFYYTHLSGYANEGAGYVAQGTVIGYVGMTGNAPVPHLHFEHHPGGRGNPVNPYPTLISSC